MLTDEHFFRLQRTTACASDQLPLQASAESLRGFNEEAHEAIDAMAAVVADAQAGLNWVRVEPLALEELREVLDSIVNNGKRAADIVLRLRGFAKEVHKPGGVADH
ncbi:hypothetical protein XH99_29080 [Bradyrhizobium nanningense]|uniref:Signal transduction histidine kinase n=1 Tax=Bradyrhizobium nanningense TaxID=1325118 RepID=A0A4V1L1C2_9BRAD|nr:hypothetical protein [Bradyrhizobium nanningense]RXH24140.1 hypothetical protein XH99_29080 [Bradyrhizobium nanningense]RXH29303.1 hypothetical protein XH84_22710 [Bradyrhizobium nanningense]